MLKPLLQKYPDHLIVDAGGWSEIKLANRVLASQIFLEGFAELETRIYNVAGRDMLLGPRFFEETSSELNIEFLSANAYVQGKPVFKPYVILQKKLGGRDLRIGITGVTMKSTAASEDWTAGKLEFLDPLPAAEAVFQILQGQTDLQILLAHLPKEQLERFVADQGFGYDVAISSVGRERTTTPLGPTPVVLATGPQCKRLGWANVRHPSMGEFEIVGGELLGLDETVDGDSETQAWVDRMKERLSGRPPVAAPKSQESPLAGPASGLP